MHETLFLAFQIASTVRILRLKPCALDSRFLTENLPFFSSALLRRPPSSVKSRPGVWRREWAVSLFLPPSPGRHLTNYPVQFSHGCLAPSPEARDTVSFYIPRPPTLRTSGPHHSTFFPSSAAVEGKRHFRFSPLRVAAGCRLCTREKGRPALSPRISIPCPHLYGLIRSCLHARGRCGFMSLPSEVQSGDPTLVSSLIHFTLLPLSALLHTWRDLLGVSPWILRTIQFGYTLQFLVFNTRSSIYGKFKSPFTPKSVMNKPQTEGRVNPVCTVERRKRIFNTLQQ